MRTIGCAALLALALASSAAFAQEQPKGHGPDAAAALGIEVDLEPFLWRVAHDRGATLVYDEALRGKRVRARLEGLSADGLREVLSPFCVELIDDEVGGKPFLHAYLQRNVPQMATTIEPLRLGENDPVPPGNRIVSKTFRIKNADANGIQTVIRVEMTRDPRRFGNVVYSAASEVIMVTDFAPAVRRYAAIVAELDRPPERDRLLGNLRVDVEVWALAKAEIGPETAADDVRRRGPDARLLALTAASALPHPPPPVPGAHAPQPVSTTASFGGNGTLTVAVAPAVPGGRLPGASLQLSASRGGVTVLSVPWREIRLRPGEWTVAYAGDPGLVLLVRAREE